VLICGGGTATETTDRPSLSVDQEAFINEVAKQLAKQMTVVSLTMSPGAIVMPWIEDVHSALNVFMAGHFTGTAFLANLFGDSTPSAKLLTTFPKREEDAIAPCEELVCNYSEQLFVGFPRYEDKEVTFPFGHGLSYTQFSYSGIVVLPTTTYAPGCSDAEALCIAATVTNVGLRIGAEVAQLYMGFPEGYDEPKKLLRGFVRTPQLAPGESIIVHFPLTIRDMSVWSPSSAWTRASGFFSFFVGTSSRDLSLPVQWYV